MTRFIVTAALMALVLPAAAQMSTKSTQEFVTKVAVSDMFEVESSKLALQRTKDQRVRQFADMMVKDHTKTSNELKAMVKKMDGVQVPTSMDADHQNKIKQLQSATGPQFDQQYRMQQIQGHETAVKLFEGYAQSGDNNELKAWAEKTLPHLRTHLQHAQALPPSQQAPAVSDAPTQPKGQTAKGKGARDVSAMAAPGSNHIMASQLRGTRIYGAKDENIGDVNDIVLDRSGRVAAIVVGVGGFLGIGEKNVAIPFNALEFVADQRREGTTGDGGQDRPAAQGAMRPDRIVLRGMTRADLDAAPDFRADRAADDSTTGQQQQRPKKQ